MKKKNKKKIPRIINYVWIGEKDLPEPDRTYVEGWKKACPGWEIRRWGLDDIQGEDNVFLRETIAAKKWVFVCDWLRLYALSKVGGFYLDTDVELRSSLEPFCNDELCMGLIRSGHPQTALIGSVPGHPIINELLAQYSARKFRLAEGVYDETASNSIYKKLFMRRGVDFERLTQEHDTEVLPGVRFYPAWQLCSQQEGKPNVATHHHVGYWLDPYKRKSVTWLPFGRRLIRMKRRKVAKPGDPLNLMDNEKLSFSWRFGRLVLAFVRLDPPPPSIGKRIENAYHALCASRGARKCRRKWREIEPKKIVFNQFQGGGFGCNQKYIALELLRRRKDLDLVWLVRDKDETGFPEGIRTVPWKSEAALRELATARVWCSNHNLGHFIKNRGLVKKEGQFYLQTWHGSFGIKRCLEVLGEKETSMLDVFMANGTWEAALARGWFGAKPKIELAGHPRNDIIVDSARGGLEDGLAAGRETRTLLYAPTFRDGGETDCYLTDFTAVREALCKRWPGEWRVQARLHPHLRKKGVSLRFKGDVEDVTDAPDIQELLAAADVVVSDYSSCMFDFALSGRPVFVCAQDREAYETERGFYYPLSETPFPVTESAEELAAAIRYFDAAEYADELAGFLSGKGSAEDGRAAERAADMILAGESREI